MLILAVYKQCFKKQAAVAYLRTWHVLNTLVCEHFTGTKLLSETKSHNELG